MRRLPAAAAAALLMVIAGCGAGPGSPAPERPPDVLLVLVDALRRDHVGCYGYPKPTTPFLDELAAGGVVFEDALAQAPQTLNSTASLMTSRRFPLLLWGVEHEPIPGVAPERREQWAQTPRLAAANLTLAEVLQDGGYETVALFNNPHHHATSGFGQGFETSRLLPRDPDTAYARAASLVDAFLEWHSGRDGSRPYFAYLHAMDPHNPYRPTAAVRALFPPPEGRHLYANGPPDPGFTEADLAHMTALYDAEIRAFDTELERLVEELERRDGPDRTVVVVTADHGEELMDHGGLGHGKTVELELLRIPLVMAGGPFAAEAGTRVRSLVRNLDLAPTIVDLAGLSIPAELEGVSLLSLVEGGAPAQPLVSFAWISRLRSLTSAEWHCMRPLDAERTVLYHRPTDPAGTINRAAGHPDVVAMCEARLERLEAERLETERRARVLKGLETGAGMPPGSADVLEQLRALGYVE